MDNLITGLVGVTMVVVFLGYYAISLNSAPLDAKLQAISWPGERVCQDCKSEPNWREGTVPLTTIPLTTIPLRNYDP